MTEYFPRITLLALERGKFNDSPRIRKQSMADG